MKYIIVFFFLFVKIVNGIYLNPYSYGSYDPAAESPELYNYYARYYNPNRHNPYAPYPTYMKPGVFRLPRMYQIDPAWAPYYPPNRFETLPQAQGNFQQFRPRSLGETVAIFPDGCGGGGGGGDRNIGSKITEPKSETQLLLEDLDKGGNGGYLGYLRQISRDYNQGQPRPQWSATQPTSEQLDGFAQRATLIRPKVNHPSSAAAFSNEPKNSPSFEGGSSGCGCGGSNNPPPSIPQNGCIPCGAGGAGGEDSESNISSDFERLPLDRINNSHDSDSEGFPNPSSSPNFYRH